MRTRGLDGVAMTDSVSGDERGSGRGVDWSPSPPRRTWRAVLADRWPTMHELLMTSA